MIKNIPSRLVLTGLLLGVATTAARAQAPDPIKFGKIDEKDLSEANFVADSAAEAVVLCDYGRSRFEVGSDDFKVVFERVARIKILKKSGYDHATISVPLYHKNGKEEKLTNLRGLTYNVVNGQVVKDKLEGDAIFKEESGPNWTVRKFTLPNVRKGSVIEFTYTVNSDFIFNFQDWTFQSDIPVRWSEYRASIPEYFDYKMLLQGYEPLAVQERTEGMGQYSVRWAPTITPGLNGGRESGGSASLTPRVTNYRWAMKDVVPLREEPYMTTTADYVSHIDFELAGITWPGQPYKSVIDSWEKINSELIQDENFGGQLSKGSFLKAEMATLKTKYPDPAARAAAVHQFVRQAVKYNGRAGVYSSVPIRRVYEQKTGTAADVNLLLIALLREAGLTAHPVLLSTRDHGRANEMLPLLSNFNYVVGMVTLGENQELYVDATEELAPCGMLPYRCLNGQGRLVTAKDADARWVPLASASKRQQMYRQIQLVLDEKGGLTGTVRQEYGGYRALSQRDRLRTLGEKKYIEELLADHDGWSIPKYTFQQRDALHQPLLLEYEFTSAGAEAPASTLYINPMRQFGMDKNPFLHEDRRFPVDFGALLDETVIMNITVPTGYELEETPKSGIVDLPNGGGRFLYSVQPTPGKIQITSRLNLLKPVYSAEEYVYLREFFNQLLTKQGEQLVLKKKS
ncbi:DUF3857 domain-containing protein [Hymenobacter sp. AT01-02]|uniref:DUF3857 domain-containing protein n=1 Tax=Hymenobacter sp. AT01-02 TaxID=1571877 RepID=UPI0005F20ED7|nr:DUF3857 domain-containing protein [Hymenobacter sp. AT01-02]